MLNCRKSYEKPTVDIVARNARVSFGCSNSSALEMQRWKSITTTNRLTIRSKAHLFCITSHAICSPLKIIPTRNSHDVKFFYYARARTYVARTFRRVKFVRVHDIRVISKFKIATSLREKGSREIRKIHVISCHLRIKGL